MLRHVSLLSGSAPVVRNDQLSLLQELVCHAHAFTQQTAGIGAQVKDQALEIAKRIERIGNFMFGGLIETVDVHVSHAWLNQEMNIDTVARNFVADKRELHRLLNVFARDADVNG